MKRLIAGIIAITAVLCTLTGCGKDTADDSSSTSAETTAAQEETTDEEVTSVASAEIGSYEDTVKEFVEAYIDNDREKTLKMQYPEGVMDFVKLFMRSDEAEDMTEEDIITFLQYEAYDNYDEDAKVTYKGIISVEPLRSHEEDDIKESYSPMKWAVNYINEHGGPDKVNPDEFEDAWEDLDYDEYPCEVDIEEGYLVIFEVENDEGETSEGTLYVVRIKGENGWKISVVNMYGNVKSGRKKAMNSTAYSLRNALYTSFVEMDEEGKLPSSDKMFIVSSDDSMNYNVPDDFDVELLRKKAQNYFDKIKELKWFAVINHGDVEYLSVIYYDDERYVGTYPSDYIMVAAGDDADSYTEPDEKADERTFKELHDICVEVIGK